MPVAAVAVALLAAVTSVGVATADPVPVTAPGAQGTTTAPSTTAPGPASASVPPTTASPAAPTTTTTTAPPGQATPEAPSPDLAIQAVADSDRAAAAALFDLGAATDDHQQAAVSMLRATQARNTAIRRVANAIAVEREAAARLRRFRQQLAALSTRAYVNAGSTNLDGLARLLRGDTTDRQAGQGLLFDRVVAHEVAAVADARRALARARVRTAARRRTQAAVQRTLDGATAALSDRDRRLADATALQAQAVQAQAAARSELRAEAAINIPLTVPIDVPLLGDPVLDAADLTGWFESAQYHPLVATPIAFYAAWFIDEGRQEGVRGDIAFAQAVVETGGFSNPDSVLLNNFSGIGHCDTCASGWAFATPALGVRAQIQLLKSYAVKNPVYANPLVDKRLHGPAGCCPTWGDLTHVWATAPEYGPIVMAVYGQIVSYALRRHAALAG